MRKMIRGYPLKFAVRQWRHRRKRPPNASCSCISCCLTECRSHARASTDQHQRGVAIGKCFDYSSSLPDLAIKAVNEFIRTHPRPVFRWEAAIGQCCFNTVFYFLRCFLQLHLVQLSEDRFDYFAGGLLGLHFACISPPGSASWSPLTARSAFLLRCCAPVREFTPEFLLIRCCNLLRPGSQAPLRMRSITDLLYHTPMNRVHFFLLKLLYLIF